jgi:hypothetical protein
MFSQGDANFVVIGHDYGMKVCIKEGTGEVFAIDDKGEFLTTYINSRIEFLLIFLEIWLKEQKIYRTRKTEEETKEDVKYLKEKFMALDTKAFDDPENWWSVILGGVPQLRV